MPKNKYRRSTFSSTRDPVARFVNNASPVLVFLLCSVMFYIFFCVMSLCYHTISDATTQATATTIPVTAPALTPAFDASLFTTSG